MQHHNHHDFRVTLPAWHQDPIPAAARALRILIPALERLKRSCPGAQGRPLRVMIIPFFLALDSTLHSLREKHPASCEYLARSIMRIFEGMATEMRRREAERLRPPAVADDEYVWTENDVERDDRGRFAPKGGGGSGGGEPLDLVARMEKGPRNTGGGEKRELAAQTHKAPQQSAGDPVAVYRNLAGADKSAPPLPDMAKLRSNSEQERRKAFTQVMRAAAAAEAKDKALASALRAKAEGSVDTMYYLVNDHIQEQAEEKIKAYDNGKLGKGGVEQLPFEEKMAIRLELYIRDESSRKRTLTTILDNNILLNPSLNSVIKRGTKTEAQQARKKLIPPQYEQETSRKVQALTDKLLQNKQLHADAEKWDSLNDRQKQEMLTRWLNVMTAELGIPGKHGFTMSGNSTQMFVAPHFDSDKKDNTRFTLYTEQNIMMGNGVWKDKNFTTLYGALYPVLHEVMHMHEARAMNAVLKSRTASPRERAYAMKVVCAAMAGRPLPENHDIHLTESSAIYFSNQYMEKLEKYNLGARK